MQVRVLGREVLHHLVALLVPPQRYVQPARLKHVVALVLQALALSQFLLVLQLPRLLPRVPAQQLHIGREGGVGWYFALQPASRTERVLGAHAHRRRLALLHLHHDVVQAGEGCLVALDCELHLVRCLHLHPLRRVQRQPHSDLLVLLWPLPPLTLSHHLLHEPAVVQQIVLVAPVQQLHLKHKGGVRGDLGGRSRLAVRVLGLQREHRRLALAHGRHANVPPFNHLPLVQHELKRLAAPAAGVELLARGLQGAHVMHTYLRTLARLLVARPLLHDALHHAAVAAQVLRLVALLLLLLHLHVLLLQVRC
mmetsp:Transcript_1992/g.4602  ORF Transcript_1992/g.4602 Transcript_1992/m.4602 type:complete len:309 (-) Transcript_1992:171-1097(-)